MIKLLEEGEYKLIETANQIKILSLNDNNYVWVNAGEIGEILVVSSKKHKAHHTLSLGKYRLYKITNEPNLTDLIHLELHTGNGTWQGYLLPTGLPDNQDKRNRIIPTKEIVTKTTR